MINQNKCKHKFIIIVHWAHTVIFCEKCGVKSNDLNIDGSVKKFSSLWRN